MEYKHINYNEFCGTFIGWNMLEEKHYHDLAERKYYNEYTMQMPNNIKIILIICHYYHKKRVQVNFLYDNKLLGYEIVLGNKQIKQILLTNKENNNYLLDISFTVCIYYHSEYFTEDNIRNLINFFYN